MYIIMDLDDTLLTSSKRISDYTLSVLRRCQESGHKLIISTARSFYQAIEVINLVKPYFAILNEGGLVLNNANEIIFSHTICEEMSSHLIKELVEISSRISAETPDGLYSSSDVYRDSESKYFDFVNMPFEKACFQILACSKNSDHIRVLASKYCLEFFTYPDGNWRRFKPLNADKWNAVVEAIQFDNGDVRETIAFGDDVGDLRMLQQANVGVAMGNSCQTVLDSIAIQTNTNDDDGVASFLESELL